MPPRPGSASGWSTVGGAGPCSHLMYVTTWPVVRKSRKEKMRPAIKGSPKEGGVSEGLQRCRVRSSPARGPHGAQLTGVDAVGDGKGKRLDDHGQKGGQRGGHVHPVDVPRLSHHHGAHQHQHGRRGHGGHRLRKRRVGATRGDSRFAQEVRGSWPERHAHTVDRRSYLQDGRQEEREEEAARHRDAHQARAPALLDAHLRTSGGARGQGFPPTPVRPRLSRAHAQARRTALSAAMMSGVVPVTAPSAVPAAERRARAHQGHTSWRRASPAPGRWQAPQAPPLRTPAAAER